ncbi:MAG: 4'-phosphopantetheinyl transferase superfamily protein [Clostridiales bacterium]|nr:4'-phosphopantetheinyl transferase superfamily protein [Clostridiales bacterium]
MDIKIVYADTAQPFINYEKYLPLLPEQRRERIVRLRRDGVKIISLLTGLLIRKEISEQLGILPEEQVFGYGTHGKPYLVNDENYYFSVSHSGSCIAFAGGDAPVGIDVERIREGKLHIAKRFFTENEYSFIKSSGEPDIDFYKIWTAKEAYVKMRGTGLSESLSSFDVLNGSLSCGFCTRLLPGYALTVCTEQNATNNIITDVLTADCLLEQRV